MIVSLGTISKRVNSTKQGAGTEFDVVLKEPCSILSPRIAFSTVNGSPAAYNYAYIPAFSRYYYVQDWTANGSMWIGSLIVDPLASFKTQIGTSSQYILRSSSVSNGDIVDDMYPITANSTKQSVAIHGFAGTNSGTYVLGVFGASGYESIRRFGMTQIQMANLFNTLWDDATWEAVKKYNMNPTQYIASLQWFPFTIPTGTDMVPIKLGNFDTGSVGYPITAKTMALNDLGIISIPKHPSASSRGDYLNLYPYSEYRLSWIPVGTVALDSHLMCKEKTLRCNGLLDIATGALAVNIIAGQTLMQTIYTSGGVTIPVAQQTSDKVGAFTQFAGGAASGITAATVGISTAVKWGSAAAAGGPAGLAVGAAMAGAAGILGAASSINAGIGNAAKSVAPVVTTNGQTNSYFIAGTSMFLECTFHDIATEGKELLGRPYCHTSSIASHKYSQSKDPSVSIAGAYPEEINYINQCLAQGLFYE